MFRNVCKLAWLRITYANLAWKENSVYVITSSTSLFRRSFVEQIWTISHGWHLKFVRARHKASSSNTLWQTDESPSTVRFDFQQRFFLKESLYKSLFKTLFGTLHSVSCWITSKSCCGKPTGFNTDGCPTKTPHAYRCGWPASPAKRTPRVVHS